MGSSYSVYVGPYIRCVNVRKKVTTQTRTCTNKTCPTHGKHRGHEFCPQCGSEVREVGVERDGWEIDVSELYENLYILGDGSLHTLGGEYSSPEEIDLWAPNGSWGQDRQFTFNSGGGELAADADQCEEAVAFSVKFDAHIKMLIEAYGADKVSLKWGPIGDWG